MDSVSNSEEEKKPLEVEIVPDQEKKYFKYWWNRNEKFISLFLFIVLIIVALNLIGYLSIIFPDKFTDTPEKRTIPELSGLTLYYPGRVVDGRDYDIAVHFKLPDNSPNSDYRFYFETDWDDSTISPRELEFTADQHGMGKQVLTLDLEPADDLPKSFKIIVKQVYPPGVDESPQDLNIRIVELPDYILQIITILTVLGTLILKFLMDASIRLWEKRNQKKDEINL